MKLSMKTTKTIKEVAQLVREEKAKKPICLGMGTRAVVELEDLAKWLENNCHDKLPWFELGWGD